MYSYTHMCSRMDQIFGNHCLKWRVLRMCRDIAKMTIKRFFVSFSCTATHWKFRTDSQTTWQNKQRRPLESSFRCHFVFVTDCTQKLNEKTFYCHLCNVSTHSEHAPCEAMFLPILSLWRWHPESSLLLSYPYFLT